MYSLQVLFTESGAPTLALQDINYRVRYRSGPWWRGACFRHQHVKHVLRDVNRALPAGQLIGLVGSSGKEFYFLITINIKVAVLI
jgi:ABC-type glutathione transport system ATPase component